MSESISIPDRVKKVESFSRKAMHADRQTAMRRDPKDQKAGFYRQSGGAKIVRKLR